MRSLKFPNMFNTNSSNVWKSDEYLDATKQNSGLLLHIERGELFGDPYYGVLFKHYLFNQNNTILKENLIDIIYTQLALFIPQLRIKRTDIQIINNKEKGKIYIKFSGINQIDYKVNTYSLLLYQNSEN